MSNNVKTILIAAILVVLAVFAVMALNTPDDRTLGEKTGDAIDTLSEGEGLGEAADEFEDQTAFEKMQDGAGDVYEDIKEGTAETMDSAGEKMEAAGEEIKEIVDDAGEAIDDAMDGDNAEIDEEGADVDWQTAE